MGRLRDPLPEQVSCLRSIQPNAQGARLETAIQCRILCPRSSSDVSPRECAGLGLQRHAFWHHAGLVPFVLHQRRSKLSFAYTQGVGQTILPSVRGRERWARIQLRYGESLPLTNCRHGQFVMIQKKALLWECLLYQTKIPAEARLYHYNP
jgi:hypothetical protein